MFVRRRAGTNCANICRRRWGTLERKNAVNVAPRKSRVCCDCVVTNIFAEISSLVAENTCALCWLLMIKRYCGRHLTYFCKDGGNVARGLS